MIECNTGTDCEDCTGCDVNLGEVVAEVTNPDMGMFQDVEINFAEAYHEARKMMGTIGTDLNELSYNVTLMYVNAPDKWVKPYFNLVNEIEMRQAALRFAALGL